LKWFTGYCKKILLTERKDSTFLNFTASLLLLGFLKYKKYNFLNINSSVKIQYKIQNNHMTEAIVNVGFNPNGENTLKLYCLKHVPGLKPGI
jgi:hypothetical protein